MFDLKKKKQTNDIIQVTVVNKENTFEEILQQTKNIR